MNFLLFLLGYVVGQLMVALFIWLWKTAFNWEQKQ